MSEFIVQQGWQCPICKRVYSPFTPCCFNCGGNTVITTGIIPNAKDIDWKKQSTVTTATTIPYMDWQKYPTETTTNDTETVDEHKCDTCKYYVSTNGVDRCSGKAACYGHSRWEKKA